MVSIYFGSSIEKLVMGRISICAGRTSQKTLAGAHWERDWWTARALDQNGRHKFMRIHFRSQGTEGKNAALRNGEVGDESSVPGQWGCGQQCGRCTELSHAS